MKSGNGEWPFLGCENLKTAGPLGGGYDVEFGWRESFPDDIFSSWLSLTSVTIPSTMTSTGDGVFSGCKNLVNVTIMPGVESIGSWLFATCANLPKVVLPETVTHIGRSAFTATPALTEIWIPASVTTIDQAAFNSCMNLTDVYYGGSEEQWQKITVERETNQYLYSATIHYNSTMPGIAYEITVPAEVENGSITVEPANAEAGETVALTVTADEGYELDTLTVTDEDGNAVEVSEAAAVMMLAAEEEAVPAAGKTYNFTFVMPDSPVEVNVSFKKISPTVPDEDHTHNYTAVVTAPTCTEAGYTTYTCTCGDSYISNRVPAKGHTWNKGVVTKAPTETETGIRTFTCTVCGETKTETIPKLDHTHSYEAVVTAPTCTEAGYTTYTCSCGDSYIDNEVPALGHSFGEWVTVQEATTEEEGLQERTCSRCGETETRPIEKLPAENEDPDPVANPFVDVDEADYFYDAILWAVENGITTGVDDTHFAPSNPCTRAQVVTFLWRAAGEPAPAGDDNPFTDLDESAYYYDVVLWAVENGITTGTTATTFEPSKPCTRAQVAAFLWRAAGEPAPVGDDNLFTDLDETIYYYDAVLWAVENGITTGTTPTTFSPSDICTRAQIVTFLYRAEA